MRILTVLTYYRPHWTGLTKTAQLVAEGLARRGHEVTVVAGRHTPGLPREERLDEVNVVRVTSIGRVSRGLVMPGFAPTVLRLAAEHDVVHMHTPMLESWLVTALAGRRDRPVVITHQGDLVMPSGGFNGLVQRGVSASMDRAVRRAAAVTTLSDDYARHSSFLRPVLDKTEGIPPPARLPAPDREAVAAWRAELGLTDAPVVGFAGRWVEEKGFDVLLEALPLMLERRPDLRLVYAGDHRIPYERFFDRCAPLVERHPDHLTFVGLLRDQQRLADFYALGDVFAVPSRSDCFALVQAEALMSNTPVVVSDIPGAREPIMRTGLGRLVPPEDTGALADALLEVLDEPERYADARERVLAEYDPERALDAYERVLARAVQNGHPGGA
jgi:glycosyltransferase involved in cell wall biosynthesis